MPEPSSSLADEFERVSRGRLQEIMEFVYDKHDRILAALRGNEEDARIARIVREPTPRELGAISDVLDDVMFDSAERETATSLVFSATIALANEAGAAEGRG